MASDYLRLSGGSVVDPANAIDGEIRDIWIRDGKIVGPPSDPGSETVNTIDVTGRVVMAGAIDMHCHIAGPKVNAARKMRPEQMRLHSSSCRYDAPMSCVPDIHTTGLRYTGLGYTCCFDAAVTPLASRGVRHELELIPNVDTGFYVLVGNNHYAMQRIADDDQAGLQSFLGWLLSSCEAYAPKLVNPGGVEMWKQRARGNARDLDDSVGGFEITPRQIVGELAIAANELKLPHPVHIHCNNLGIPGNHSTTLETLKTVQGLRAHLTHIQFHSYGGGDASEDSLCSMVKPLAEFVNGSPETTVDVGQVMFGDTTSLTADGPLGYFLHTIGSERWYSADVELESGCGVSPIRYRNQSLVNSLQWAIGLEWYLLAENPWQVVMSSDHPNGASFLAYPKIVRLLMDREFRREQLGLVNQKVLRYSSLADLDREYTLSEIAVITRAGPARILGLKNKGHLGIGADADITVYSPDRNYETMFAWPMLVIKAGAVLVRDGEFQQQTRGQNLQSRPDYDRSADDMIENWMQDHYSIPLNPV